MRHVVQQRGVDKMAQSLYNLTHLGYSSAPDYITMYLDKSDVIDLIHRLLDELCADKDGKYEISVSGTLTKEDY